MFASPVAGIDWQLSRDESVVEILTHDEDGDLRETSIWIVSLDGNGYVRTNDSRWLANIRRGSDVTLRLDDEEFSVTARETDDAEIAARVEESFKEKYGFVQRMMSWFRTAEPTVLELKAN
jgi:hypothetical protein